MKEHDHAPLREAIVAVVRETPMKVLVCPEDASQMEIGKEMLVDKLPDDVKAQVVWRENYWLTDEALSTYVRSAGLFGAEMHSPIMCIGNGMPAIVCRWEEQTSKGFMWRDIGLGEWLFDMDDEEEIARDRARRAGDGEGPRGGEGEGGEGARIRPRAAARGDACGRCGVGGLAAFADADAHDLARRVLEDLGELRAVRFLAAEELPHAADTAERQLAVGRVVHVVQRAERCGAADVLVIGPCPLEAVVAVDEDGVETLVREVERSLAHDVAQRDEPAHFRMENEPRPEVDGRRFERRIEAREIGRRQRCRGAIETADFEISGRPPLAEHDEIARKLARELDDALLRSVDELGLGFVGDVILGDRHQAHAADHLGEPVE